MRGGGVTTSAFAAIKIDAALLFTQKTEFWLALPNHPISVCFMFHAHLEFRVALSV
jgi:hypothetical protein